MIGISNISPNTDSILDEVVNASLGFYIRLDPVTKGAKIEPLNMYLENSAGLSITVPQTLPVRFQRKYACAIVCNGKEVCFNMLVSKRSDPRNTFAEECKGLVLERLATPGISD